ncbi:large ribosomal subunit protein mL62 isoform 2-T2 [Trichechus inunguis]
MAAAGCFRWGVSRAGAWLLPPPACCPRRTLHKQVDGAEFQSIYSLDKLYPESNGPDTAWKVPDDAKQANNDIPIDRLTISYCRSSGPGGQNVNKVNSKAEVRFHLATADWIAEPVRQKIAITDRKHESGKAATKKNKFCHQDKPKGRHGLRLPLQPAKTTLQGVRAAAAKSPLIP